MMIRNFFIIFVTVFFTSLHSIDSDVRIITDTEGRTVRIPKKVERAVVLTATCIEAIYICGALPRVVGITKQIFSNPIYSEIIEGLKDIPIVAQTEADVNMEKLLALKPDIVIGLGPEHPVGLDKKIVDRIESFKIPVVLTNLTSLDENFYSVETIGKIFGEEKRASELIKEMKKIMRMVEEKVKKIPEERKVKVLTVGGDKPTTVLGGYWKEQDVKVLAGGKNVASLIPQFVTVVSLEQIVAWNPDIITVTHLANYGPEDIISNSQLRHVNAVRTKRVYQNPYHIGGIFTPRLPLQIAWHAKKYYPEIDIDWVKITDNFFKKFYGKPYTGPKN